MKRPAENLGRPSGRAEALKVPAESPLTKDRTGLVEAVREAVSDQVAYMVDMAKAEALDMLGETRLALELVDRHA